MHVPVKVHATLCALQAGVLGVPVKLAAQAMAEQAPTATAVAPPVQAKAAEGVVQVLAEK